MLAGGSECVEGQIDKQQHLCDRSPIRLCGHIFEWVSHKDTSVLKHYMTKNNTESEQAAFDDALCSKDASNITPTSCCLPYLSTFSCSVLELGPWLSSCTSTLTCVVPLFSLPCSYR